MTDLQYRDFIWPNAPDSLRVELARNVRRLTLPFSGETLQDLGAGKRTVSGKGRFFGPDCLTQFNRLSAAFLEAGAGLFHMPGLPPFLAAPLSLSLYGEAEPDCVHYAFSLAEAEEPARDDGVLQGGAYRCAGRENLWAIAARLGVSVETLLERNPGVKWPNDLEEGSVVILS